MSFAPSEKHPSQVPALKQQLGPFQFFAIAFGSIIGVGWMIVVGDWLQSAGPLGVSLAFLGSAGMIVLVGLCYAELATMLPVVGGEIAYTYLTSGPFLAYGVGWFLVLGYVAICAFEAVSLGRILGFLFPALNTLTAEVAGVSIPVGHVGVGLGGTVLIGGVNWRGVRLASQLQTVLTCILFLLTALFVGAALWKGQVSHLAPLFAAQSGQSALSGVFWIFVTAPLWYMGFDIIPQMVEEAAPTFSLKRLSIINSAFNWRGCGVLRVRGCGHSHCLALASGGRWSVYDPVGICLTHESGRLWLAG